MEMMTTISQARIKVQEKELTQLRAENELLHAEITRLQAQYDETEKARAVNYAKVQQLTAENKRLMADLREERGYISYDLGDDK
jgi:peptidoglycan hydrolase CwlO-like protein